LAVLEQLAGATEKWPWIAPCAGLPDTEYVAEKYAALDRLLRMRLAIVRLHPGQVVTPVAVAKAVAARYAPTPEGLGGWICRRVGVQELSTALVEQFAYAFGARLDLPHSKSWYSRTFSPRRLTARDWRAVARVASAHHVAVRERLKLRGDREGPPKLSVRAASRYAVKYLGMTWASAIQRVGWEWVLESVVRRKCGVATA
jgi:hypothetical protein